MLPAGNLAETLGFFVDRLAFRIEAISPADRPRRAVLRGHGLRLALEPHASLAPGALVLWCEDLPEWAKEGRELRAPNGCRVLLRSAERPLTLPELRPSFVLRRASESADWIAGRAGMQYRDLIPDRQGGRFIASHIRILEGGSVADYVHHHHIRFQLIYCHRGWVKVVYEDQGPPFVLHPGDAVLQPPHIRHQVLESSPGLEVIEISSPAEHDTLGDLEMVLPTPHHRPRRSFGGQRFVHHRADAAKWEHSRIEGWQTRSLGVYAATDGLASVRVLRPYETRTARLPAHDAELRLWYVLSGQTTLDLDGFDAEELRTDDSVVIPPGADHGLNRSSSDLQLLEVCLPPRD